MIYSLVIALDATKDLVHMDEIRHGLFVMAMLDLQNDPHSRGTEIGGDGVRVHRAMKLGGLGTILYIVDEDTRRVEVTEVIWTG